MAISVSKKKNRLSKRKETNEISFFYSFLTRTFLRFPAAIFLLILILLYASSTTIISGNIVHVCVSSRKLNNLYCISAGSQPSFEVPASPQSKLEVPVLQNGSSSFSTNGDNNGNIKEVVNVVLESPNVAVDDGGKAANQDLKVLVPPDNNNSDFITDQKVVDVVLESSFSPSNSSIDKSYYGGLDILRWHFKNVSNDVKDSLALELIRWLETREPWYRRAGKDHVFVLGKISWDFRRNSTSSWGTRLLEQAEMQNPIKLLIERQPWQVNDIGIPHPTSFHPHTDDDIVSAVQVDVINLKPSLSSSRNQNSACSLQVTVQQENQYLIL